MVTTACAEKTDSKTPVIQTPKERLSSNLVYVEGGQFQMGDVGKLDPRTEGLNYSFDASTRPIHTVELSPYYIQKYRVTNQDYDDYLAATGKPDTRQIKPSDRWPDEMVSVTWYEAHDYCTWAGSLIGKEGDLPTEAQWEYAARSRGQIVPFATDNGMPELGRNAPTVEQLKAMHPNNHIYTIRVGRYPPNPLGLYDLSYGGLEWQKDWYSADYYKHSPLKDPQGPEKGEKKSARGLPFYEDGYFGKPIQVIYTRYHYHPTLYDNYFKKDGPTWGLGMRCSFK